MTGKHYTVMLVVTGLSDGVTRKELKSIFRHLIKSSWRARWSGQGLIRSCDIVRITDRDTGKVEYHGLVELQPAKLALRAIRELSGTEIGGKPIKIRRYHRSPLHNQHRYVPEGESAERIRDDRRRPNLMVELVERQEAALLPSLTRWLAPAPLEDCKLKDPERRTV
jgi:RNA recognition motif-containing protein